MSSEHQKKKWIVQKRCDLFLGPAFSSQSELFESFLNWLIGCQPAEKVTSFFLRHVQ